MKTILILALFAASVYAQSGTLRSLTPQRAGVLADRVDGFRKDLDTLLCGSGSSDVAQEFCFKADDVLLRLVGTIRTRPAGVQLKQVSDVVKYVGINAGMIAGMLFKNDTPEFRQFVNSGQRIQDALGSKAVNGKSDENDDGENKQVELRVDYFVGCVRSSNSCGGF